MAREKSNYYATLGADLTQANGARLGFRSYTDLYKDIQGDLGIKTVGQKGTGFLIYGKASEMLPKLRLKLSGKNLQLNILTNAGQTDGKASSTVFCDPYNLEKAFKNLIGKNCRGREIAGVRLPKRRVYV
jgi:hypothetical protein